MEFWLVLEVERIKKLVGKLVLPNLGILNIYRIVGIL